MTEDDVLNRIRYFLKFKHWSVYRLAKESQIPYSSLNNSFLRKNCPTLPTLEKICQGLDISLSAFFDYNVNPLHNAELTDTEQDLVNSYRSLSIKDKELLEAYMRGLCKR